VEAKRAASESGPYNFLALRRRINTEGTEIRAQRTQRRRKQEREREKRKEKDLTQRAQT